MYNTKILGTGIYLPKKVVSNFDLEKVLDTTNEWILERTGIKNRRICSYEGGEWPTDMANHATKQALTNAGLQPNDIDMILFACVNPDQRLPNSSSLLQAKLGITNQCACLDISAACSGFVYGVHLAHALITSGMMKNILVVASEILSRDTDWMDRTSCILFGDGCGAAIVGRTDAKDTSGILSTMIASDASGKEFFELIPGGSIQPITAEIIEKRQNFMMMQGREMFKVAVKTLADNATKAIAKAGLTKEQVDWLVPHQANARIIEATAARLEIPMEKVITNIENLGNTSAATVPIAFHQAIEEGKIKRGDIIVFDVFGAGLTSGAIVFRY